MWDIRNHRRLRMAIEIFHAAKEAIRRLQFERDWEKARADTAVSLLAAQAAAQKSTDEATRAAVILQLPSPWNLIKETENEQD